jgi:diguanylate cyclase (GGDEF)-like protein/PAS domain S-box-containing protein
MATLDVRFLPSNLKFRLTAVVIVLVLAATVLVTLIALMLAERDMKGVIGDQQYALVSSAAAFIDDRLDAKKQLMASIAAALPEAARADPRQLQAFLESRLSARDEFLNLSAFGKDGVLLASLVKPGSPEPMSSAGKHYFEQTLARKQGIVSAPFKGKLTNSQIVLLTHPVFDANGEIALILTGSIDLRRSNSLRQVETLKPGKTGFIFIMTFDGIVIDHPVKSRLLEQINLGPGANQATGKALAGFEGWTEAANRAGSAGIYAFKRLKATDWIVGARYPTAEAFAPMINMRRHAVYAATAFAAIAGLVAWLLIYRLLTPLETLRRNVSAIRNKRADIGVLQVTRDDEIGELGRAFYELMAEREAAQEKITAGEKRARIIADSMPALIAYVNSEQRYEFTNAHYRDMLGVEPKSLIGKTARECLGERNYAMLEDKIAAALRGERMHFEHAPLEAGRSVHYMADYIPDFADDGSVPGFYVLVMDISARKTAELTQAASEKRLKLITDNLPVLIAYINRDRSIRFGNATFQKWFGIAPSKLVGRALGDVLGTEAYLRTRHHLEHAFAGEPVTFELKTSVDGSVRILETTFIPDVQGDGSVAGVYALTHDMTRIKEVEEKLMQLARVDSLTGIANRRMFGERLHDAHERSRRQQTSMALAYLDIDHFKKINDTFGHAIGDLVLKEFARRLLANVRSTDTVARLSGDEFVIILEGIANPHEVTGIVAKIIDAVRIPIDGPGQPLRVTTSVGIALFGGGTQTHEDLLANADRALYVAKHKGRDGYTVYGRQPEQSDGLASLPRR